MWFLTDSPMKTVTFFPILRRTVCHRGTATEADNCGNIEIRNAKCVVTLYHALWGNYTAVKPLGEQSVLLQLHLTSRASRRCWKWAPSPAA